MLYDTVSIDADLASCVHMTAFDDVMTTTMSCQLWQSCMCSGDSRLHDHGEIRTTRRSVSFYGEAKLCVLCSI